MSYAILLLYNMFRCGASCNPPSPPWRTPQCPPLTGNSCWTRSRNRRGKKMLLIRSQKFVQQGLPNGELCQHITFWSLNSCSLWTVNRRILALCSLSLFVTKGRLCSLFFLQKRIQKIWRGWGHRSFGLFPKKHTLWRTQTSLKRQNSENTHLNWAQLLLLIFAQEQDTIGVKVKRRHNWSASYKNKAKSVLQIHSKLASPGLCSLL